VSSVCKVRTISGPHAGKVDYIEPKWLDSARESDGQETSAAPSNPPTDLMSEDELNKLKARVDQQMNQSLRK
jgi:hypothetical protein